MSEPISNFNATYYLCCGRKLAPDKAYGDVIFDMLHTLWL